MPEATSKTTATVVTAARFERGLTYAEFIARAKVNRDKFEQYYNDSPLTADDLAFFKRAAALPNGPKKILAIAEDWCGDVYRELPTIVHIAEATAADLRVFPRDENPDIMDKFLSNNGQSRAIPVFVFYTKEMLYITHFLERSANAHRELEAIRQEAVAALNLPAGTTFRTVPDGQKQAFISQIIPKIVPRFPQWRKEAIKEMRTLLSTVLNAADQA